MPKLTWDNIGERTFETGVSKGILFPMKDGAYPKGTAWSGLTNVTESPSGAEENSFYADNIKYLVLRTREEFGLTLECYTYPDEWKECNGEKEIAPGVNVGQQSRGTFGLAYQTKIGNDTELGNYGYKWHLIWGCSTSPSERAYPSEGDSVEPNTFSFEIATTSIPLEGYDATSIVTIDSTKVNKEKLKQLEDILIGTEEEDSRLPMPSEIVELFAEG